jgi:C1A family cysteine protease
MVQRSYGWVRDKPDASDVRFSLARVGLHAAPLPPHVDLRDNCPDVYDQGSLGSCTAQAIAGAVQFDQMRCGRKLIIPSRLFIYYNERAIEGTIHVDAGAAIRNGIKTINQLGCCAEEKWPYDVARFAVKPSQDCYDQAILHKSIIYESIAHDLHALKEVLAAGFPIIFGFRVYQSIETEHVASTGAVPMPRPSDHSLGGHAVLAIGYDDPTRLFLVRNSWGPDWGAQGNFLFPYDYMMMDSTADFWTIRIKPTP